jgi:hypothetical protein
MRKAFTLVEAIVVVAFLLALVGLSMPAIGPIVAALKRSSEPTVMRPYTIRLTRPDGITHHTYTIHSIVEPKVIMYPNEYGCMRVWSRRLDRVSYTQPFPAGWLVEVEPKMESDK